MNPGAAASEARRRLDDRINPIVVKEVRQSLRGRFFRVLFWFTLCLATLIGLTMISVASASHQLDSLGKSFFMAMFGVMTAAVQGFVPFSAFLSTSSEWDENTYDLLVISNLKPRQVVYGKLVSALIQALLYYSTFGPFLVFAFLLNGVDLAVLFVVLLGSFVTCVGLSLVGIALSSLAAVKVARVLLMALFGAALVGAWGVTLTFAGLLTDRPQILRDVEGQTVVAAYVSIVLAAGGLAAAIGMARFSHDEENRSSSMRVLCTLVIVAAGAWAAWLHGQFRSTHNVWVTEVVAACACFLLWLFFVSEPEELGRRVEKHLPRSTALALLASPFLPGGGRAVLLFALNAALALGGSQLALSVGGASPGDRLEVFVVVATLYAYFFLYLALPSGVASFFVRSGWARAILRLSILIGAPLTILAPALIGLFFDVRSWMDLEHPLNPVWVVTELNSPVKGGTPMVAVFGLLAGGLLTVLLNLPRVLAGLREIVVAMRRRGQARAAAER